MTRFLHMVGNAHIDPVWLWQWPEGYQEVHATFRSAVDRLDEYPDFVFTMDSILFLDWIEETDPELFARIGELIAEGRWQVIGGWWLEPDCNIPGGESFVRHALYGQRYLQERFGITATTGANIDSFGHSAQIPQLLRKAGMDSYVFLRPGPHELTLPGPVFWWESPDGSRVIAYRIPHEYTSPRADLGNHVDKALAQLPSEPEELMVFYGVGNHGGGPTKANLDSIARLNASGGLPALKLSSTRAYFDSVAQGDGLPVHAGELQHHGVGCYTSHSGIKRWNRRAENLLLRAEKWAVVAESLTGLAVPRDELTQAWKLVLFNQFHDTLAGTSIEPAYDDARDQLGHASSVASLVFNRSVQSIARRVDIPVEEGAAPAVVFNPHCWPVAADVELEFAGFPNDEARLVDEDGHAVAVQRTRGSTTLNGSRGRLVFAAELPPLGWRTYRLVPGGSPAAPLDAGATRLENDHVLLAIDPGTGRIAQLVHKATGRDLAAPRPHAVVIDDRSDTWGHRVRRYDDATGEFECASIRLTEYGPVRSRLRVESRYGSSSLVEEYLLGADASYVDVRVTLDWRERLKLLKLRYPTTVATASATFEIPYGHFERAADGGEQPGQSWVDVSDGDAGLAVLNDAKYGFDVRGGDIGVSAVRSPVWAWHEPRELDPDETYEYMDQGVQKFTLRLVPHAGDWRAAGVSRLAAELNQPVYPLLESYHDGPLPQRASHAHVDSADIALVAIKAGEDGDGAIVVRAHETAGRACAAELELLGRSWMAELGANEIATFKLDRESVEKTNLLEQ